MKKLLILLAAAALSAGTANAQTTNARPQAANGRMEQTTPEQQADRLTKQLGLSAEQRTQVLTMEQAHQAEMKTMRDQAQAGGDRTAMRQNMQTMRDKYDTQLKGILTADQYTKYSQRREDNQGSRQTKSKTRG